MVSRVRIRFRKQGDLRLISHRDLMRAIERLFRRANIAVCQSEGFHPKPRINFAAPLGLGMTGLDEVMEVDLIDEIAPAELIDVLNSQTVPGLSFGSAETLPQYHKKAVAKLLSYESPVPPDRTQEVSSRVEQFMAAASWPVQRDAKPIDIRPLVEDLTVQDGVLTMRLHVINEAGARPRDVLEVLGFSADEVMVLEMSRTAVQLQS